MFWIFSMTTGSYNEKENLTVLADKLSFAINHFSALTSIQFC